MTQMYSSQLLLQPLLVLLKTHMLERQLTKSVSLVLSVLIRALLLLLKTVHYRNLSDLLNGRIKKDPKSVTFAGGSAVGGFDHLKPLMLLQRAGFTDITKVKYIGVDSGGDALTQTIGGFTQAMTGDMSEIVGFLKTGESACNCSTD